MSKKEAEEAGNFERILGIVEGENPGPAVIAVGGMHGNERAGVLALQTVFDNLKEDASQFNGTFLGLIGNRAALQRGVRYIDEDMNRIWAPSVIDEIRQKPAGELDSSERTEIKEILEIIDGFIPQDSCHPLIFLDLHSFSASGKMVAITAPDEENIRLFSSLGVPLIFGVQEVLQGAALNYYHEQGWITVALEGGQHDEAATVQNIIASVMVTLGEAGCLQAGTMSELSTYKEYLAKRTKHLPAQVKLVHQHLIEPEDHFEMLPGFENFQPVEKGELLATDRQGKIKAQCDGYLLMPLYQKQGSDGFFFAKVVKAS